MPNILRVSAVSHKTGLSRTTIWRRERSGDFPERIHLGGRSVGWLDSEVEEWLESRPRGITDQQHRNLDKHNAGAVEAEAGTTFERPTNMDNGERPLGDQ